MIPFFLSHSLTVDGVRAANRRLPSAVTIQSVLDVKDDTPSPKIPGGRSLFNRSILILTPARALKFTAPSRERHYLWLNALSFLSRPSLDENDLVGLPPVPPRELESQPRSHLSGLRRHPIRDSIRVAKGKARSTSSKVDPAPYRSSSAVQGMREVVDKPGEAGPLVAVAADPPTVPRFSTHGRHRSNTGGAPPLGALRGLTHPPLPSSYSGFGGVTGGHVLPVESMYGGASVVGGPLSLGYGPGSFSHRASDASSTAVMNGSSNFFDAVGTVRMEAFVRGATPSPVKGQNGIRGGISSSSSSPPLASHDGNWGGKAWPGKIGAFDHRFEVADEFARADDPFRGF